MMVPLNPVAPGNLPSVSTEPVKTETPKETPKTPLQKKDFEGKTVFEAISMQAKADGTIKDGDIPKITKLIGHFPKEGENIIADHYMEGDKKYFKFDVTWKATVNDKSVEFTQVIYTSIEIPADGSKLQDASKQAYEVAKSYELLQRNLTKTDATSTMKAIRENALISFEKKTADINLSNYKTSYIPKTSSGVTLDVNLLLLDKKIEGIFNSRLQKMQGQKIVLAEGSGIPQAEIERKAAGLSHAKVDDKDFRAHVNNKLKEVEKESKAALVPKKVANSDDAVNVKQLNKELNDLLDSEPRDLNIVTALQQKIESKLNEIPEIRELQKAKKDNDDFIKILVNLNKSFKDVESDTKLEEFRARSKELEAKIISLKEDILNNPIPEEKEIEEKIELTLEGDPKLDDADESSDAELLESEEEVGGNQDLFGGDVEIGKYSPMPNVDQRDDKELI